MIRLKIVRLFLGLSMSHYYFINKHELYQERVLIE